MNCPNCEEQGLTVEMEVVEGVVSRTTNAYQDDEMGIWFECPIPTCKTQEDYVKEVDNDDFETFFQNTNITESDCVLAL